NAGNRGTGDFTEPAPADAHETPSLVEANCPGPVSPQLLSAVEALRAVPRLPGRHRQRRRREDRLRWGASANHGVALGQPDPGCTVPWATFENPECDDGIDNDGNGLVDFAGPECSAGWPYWEKPPIPTSWGIGRLVDRRTGARAAPRKAATSVESVHRLASW